jgi:hypothetical protein
MRLPQRKCFDLVMYFFRVPPFPLYTQDFFGPGAKLPYRVETPMSDRRLALLEGGGGTVAMGI